jgi:hypothetical protein
MKPYIIGSLFLLFALSSSIADVVNPVQDYAIFHGLSSGRVIYKLQIDINGDAKSDILLDTKLTQEEIAEENVETKNHYNPNVHGFTVYIGGDNGYTLSAGVKSDGELGLGVVPEIDITKCFVGPIIQLGNNGIVTIQTEISRSGVGLSQIFAYTIEGDHLLRTTLAEYDQTKISTPNPIFEQYLSDAHRTQIQLQEVAP